MIIISTPKSASSGLSALFREHLIDISYRSRRILFRRNLRSTEIGLLHPEFDQKLDIFSCFACRKSGPFMIKGHFWKLPKFVSGRYVFLYRDPKEILEAWERAYQKNIHPMNLNTLAGKQKLLDDLNAFTDYHLEGSEFIISYTDLVDNFDKVRKELALYSKKDLGYELPKKKYSR